jgi:hypothetical protein
MLSYGVWTSQEGCGPSPDLAVLQKPHRTNDRTLTGWAVDPLPRKGAPARTRLLPGRKFGRQLKEPHRPLCSSQVLLSLRLLSIQIIIIIIHHQLLFRLINISSPNYSDPTCTLRPSVLAADSPQRLIISSQFPRSSRFAVHPAAPNLPTAGPISSSHIYSSDLQIVSAITLLIRHRCFEY